MLMYSLGTINMNFSSRSPVCLQVSFELILVFELLSRVNNALLKFKKERFS